MNNDIKNLKKKLIYRSQYRGTKEMDKLIGSFVENHIDKLNNMSNFYSFIFLLASSNTGFHLVIIFFILLSRVSFLFFSSNEFPYFIM